MNGILSSAGFFAEDGGSADSGSAKIASSIGAKAEVVSLIDISVKYETSVEA
jgi:hypothetical protein